MIWNDETIERLKAEHATGKSLRQIARDWSVTPNTILGKAHRLGMLANGARKAPRAARLPRPKPVVAIPLERAATTTRSKKWAAAAFVGEAVEPAVVGRPFLDMGFGECRWIIDGAEAGGRLCCGAPTPGLSSWCPAHRALVYTPRRGFVQRSNGAREMAGAFG